MAGSEQTLKTCKKGHHYYKSSDCPTCPICEQERKPQDGLLSTLSAPARRALEHKQISTVQQLSAYSEADILALHGIGKSSIPVLKKALEEKGLSFKNI